MVSGMELTVVVFMSCSFFGGGGVPPHSMHEFENKGDAKWVPRKGMKRKGLIFLGPA
jgi:hypothetical protein